MDLLLAVDLEIVEHAQTEFFQLLQLCIISEACGTYEHKALRDIEVEVREDDLTEATWELNI